MMPRDEQLQGLSETNDMPLVSIVTVVLNAREYLRETIESVIRQSYPNIEYIVIDGGSSDGTLDVIKENEKVITTWISEKDDGIADAFNKGLQRATGELVGILNAGDVYKDGAVECAVAVHLSDPSAVICGQMEVVDDDGNVTLKKTALDRLSYKMTINHPSTFVPRKCYQSVGLFNVELALTMDYEWMLRATQKNIPFLEVDSILTVMRGGGASSQNWYRTRLEVLSIKDKYYPGSWNRLSFVWWMVSAFGRRVLERLGLGAFVRHMQSKYGF